jgi:hypothetical protein
VRAGIGSTMHDARGIVLGPVAAAIDPVPSAVMTAPERSRPNACDRISAMSVYGLSKSAALRAVLRAASGFAILLCGLGCRHRNEDVAIRSSAATGDAPAAPTAERDAAAPGIRSTSPKIDPQLRPSLRDVLSSRTCPRCGTLGRLVYVLHGEPASEEVHDMIDEGLVIWNVSGTDYDGQHWCKQCGKCSD